MNNDTLKKTKNKKFDKKSKLKSKEITKEQDDLNNFIRKKNNIQ